MTNVTKKLLLLSALLTLELQAEPMSQAGFYLQNIENSALKIEDTQSGYLCVNGEKNIGSICQPSRKIIISPKETCQWSEDTSYPCTRFGYHFTYKGANQGDQLICVATYVDTRGRKTENYQHQLDSSGEIIYSSFKTYAEVDTQIILSETHECSYQNQPLMTIEFIHYYEPKTTASQNNSSSKISIAAVPDACQKPHLDKPTAQQLLLADVRPHAANEHIPNLWSQCIYRSITTKPREIGFVYKLMLLELFDVTTLTTEELIFNAGFAAGGEDSQQIIENLGDKSFVYHSNKQTTVLVITGILGPKDSTGRPTILIANYYMKNADMPHSERQTLLIEQAREDLNNWGQ